MITANGDGFIEIERGVHKQKINSEQIITNSDHKAMKVLTYASELSTSISSLIFLLFLSLC